MKISNLVRSAMCDAHVDSIDGGAGAGYMQIRTGSAPTNTTDASTGTLLATLNFADPAFGAASNGVATANAISSDTNADATGTAGYYRIFDSNNVCIDQGSVGTSGADINFNSVSITAGDTVAISSLTMTQPAGS